MASGSTSASASASTAYGTKPGKSDTDFRRTWDKDEFTRLAEERERAKADAEADAAIPAHRKPANPQRALLQGRDYKVTLDDKLNKTVVVAANAPLSAQPGYYCDVCECTVKDSINYLDHINGKRHQKKLGMSMRVERVSVDKVREQMEAIKRKKEGITNYDFDARVEAAKQEEAERKKAKKARKAEDSGGDDGSGAADVDPDMAAMMGFGTFGGSKK